MARMTIFHPRVGILPAVRAVHREGVAVVDRTLPDVVEAVALGVRVVVVVVEAVDIEIAVILPNEAVGDTTGREGEPGLYSLQFLAWTLLPLQVT